VTEAGSPLVVPRTESRLRAIGIYLLVALAGILLFLTTFAVWVDRVALETDVFADTSEELIEDEAVRRAVATRVIDELYDEVDVEEELEGPLPEDVESLAGPTAAVLRETGPGIVERALERPRLQRMWREAVARSHGALVDVLEERSGTVSTEEGEVTLDLGDIVLEASDRIGVRDTVERRIEPDTGRVVLLRSDDLDTAQDGVRALNALAWVLPLLTLACFALVLWLGGGGRRRLTVRAIGVAILLSGVIGLLAVNLTGWYVVGDLASDEQTTEAGDHAWDIVTELLRGSFRLQIVLGLLVLLAAWVAGPGRRAVAIRRTLAPALRQRRYAYGALAIVALALLVTGRTSDFARSLGVLVVIAAIALWIEWMRRQTLREFPEAPAPAILTDARAQLSDWMQGRRVAPARGPSPPPSDLAARLQQLADLHARGELTDEEYAAAKARVLASE
jgi:Short C-terminal domain